MAFCPSCGGKLEDGAKFCPSCGEKLEAQKPAPAPEIETPPVQQSYTPPAQSYAPQPYAAAAVKEKTPGGKKIFIIIAAVAVVAIIAVLLIVLLGGKGGSASDDPNLGAYNAVSAEMAGVKMNIADIYAGGFSIELKAKNKCTMIVDGVKGSGKWSLENGAFHIEGSGLDCDGTLANGILTLEKVMGSDLAMTFEKEGGASAAVNPGAGVSKPAGEAGYYKADSLSAGEDSMNAKDFADFEELGVYYYVILNEDGTGEVCFGNEVSKITWGSGKLSADGESMEYTLDGDTLTLPELGPMVFVRSTGTPPVIPDEAAEPDSDPGDTMDGGYQDWWNGSWYGWWLVTSAKGDYTDWEGLWWDCCADVTVDGSGNGAFVIWDEETSRNEPLSVFSATVNEDSGAGDMGAAYCEVGTFMQMALQHADFVADPNLESYENIILVEFSYEDASGSFDVTMYLRPWGQLWDDWYADEDTCLPYYYEDWYLPAIEAGEEMPDTIG